jgi:hypothetical protein
MDVIWIKCGENAQIWCSLENVNLENVATTGVYMIWNAGNPGRVVRLGQGDIKDRLTKHRNDPEVLVYKQFGKLYVTWAAVLWYQLDGVEQYLADTWPPQVGAAFPAAVPIAVNSPW